MIVSYMNNNFKRFNTAFCEIKVDYVCTFIKNVPVILVEIVPMLLYECACDSQDVKATAQLFGATCT